MRPYWKGYLKLALVSCPIALHTACSTAERIAFRQINKATGNRVRQQLIDEEIREPLNPEHKVRGYELAKGQYLIVEDDELEAIEIESTHVIEIDSFVPRQQKQSRHHRRASIRIGDRTAWLGISDSNRRIRARAICLDLHDNSP
jgi:DNA end-binding protein Ku